MPRTAESARGFGAALAIALAGTLVAGLVGAGRFVPTARAAPPTNQAGAGDRAQGEGVSFAGRVIELGTGKAVAGATIVVTRSVLPGAGDEAPPWAGDTTMHTDADGRFTIAFPPDQAADSRLSVALSRVEHPDYIPRKGFAVPLAALLQGRKFGDRPFFRTVMLERGPEFSAQVVTPDGQPAADVPYEFGNWGMGSNQAEHFTNDTSGRTDAEGRIRLRMPKPQSLRITLVSERYAPFQKFWGTAEPDKNPHVFAPTDLGRLVLMPGPILSGRLLDRDGRPIAGQRVIALGRQNGLRREATSAADGSFRFAPLRPGNYDIVGEGQAHGPSIDPTARPMPSTAPVIRPAKVYLREGEPPAPVELRKLLSVRVEIRFVDSQGRPTRGSPISLSGRIPSAADGVPRFGGGMFLASAINDPEPEDTDRRLRWGCQLSPDAAGRVVFRAPRGLTDANLYTIPPDETVAYKTRLEAGGPLKPSGGGRLGTLDADRAGIEIVCYRAPTVLVSIATEDGEPVPDDARFQASFNVKGGDYGGTEVRQDDGRFRTRNLMPDHEYEFSAWAKEHVSAGLQRLSLPEGGTAELVLFLRKKPAPPAVGDPAPPFSVATLGGREWTLGGGRGKCLLLHVWSPFHGWDRDLPRLDAIGKRFGPDRLALLGLCLSVDVEAAARVVEARRLTWPQAVLRDRGADPIILEYGGLWPPSTCLISPDGTLLARDLSIDKVEQAVARALGGN